MHRLTALATTAAATAAGIAGAAVPAHAEAVVYENHDVRSNPPDTDGHEYASLDIPTGYQEDRIDWHTVGFFEQVDQGRAIIVDLQPEADTVRELKAQRAQLVEDAGDSYQELGFKVNHPDATVQARWTYSYSAPGTDDVEPIVSVMLMSGNQVKIVGKLAERKQVASIRRHVVRSVVFPS